MPLFKVHVWSEDKLNKKFVVAENLAELVSKGCDAVEVIILKLKSQTGSILGIYLGKEINKVPLSLRERF